MPFLWRSEGVTLLIAPLQLLGEQHASESALEKLGIKAVNITSENATALQGKQLLALC